MEEENPPPDCSDTSTMVDSHNVSSDDDQLPFHGFGEDTVMPDQIVINVPENDVDDITVIKKSTNPDNHNASFDDDQPPFHGFGKDTVMPDQIVINIPDNVDEDITVVKKKRKGRPKGVHNKPTELLVMPTPRRQASLSYFSPEFVPSSSAKVTTVSPSASVGFPKFKVGGTSTRSSIYLLEQPPTSTLGAAKLPKISAVMRVLFHFLTNDEGCNQNSNPRTLATKASILDAAKKTVPVIKDVWAHHFGIRLIFGLEYSEGPVTPSNIMISSDKTIADRIVKLCEEWKYLEQLSRRPDRQNECKKKEIDFKVKLDLPFNMLKKDGEQILCQAGIKDWKEELQHLRNQLSPGQIGSCDGFDMRQKKRDDRLLKEQICLENKQSVTKRKLDFIDQIEKQEKESAKEYEQVDESGNNNEDVDYEGPKIKRRKIDIMGPISVTADARGLSIRDRTAMAASVVNALGVDIIETNINVKSGWAKAKQERVKIAAKVREEFECPERVSLHWDGKLLKIKGNQKTHRVAVYVSGADKEKVQKLMSIPETQGGSGKAEATVVQGSLVSWDVKKQVANIVFDTTLTNSSGEVGACYYLELYVDSPVLWTACRHHIYELHIGRVVEVLMGNTKEPGVALFRRLKAHWYQLDINYDNLELFDYSSVPDWMAQEARDVKEWGIVQLEKGTWPRADYKEFLELTVVCLGGKVEGFKFRLPGADHHARWMSKGIYFLKMFLLSRVFTLSDEEKEMVRKIVSFTVSFYTKAWLRAPLSTSAAKNDLDFHYNVLRYRELEPKVAIKVLESIRRHQWYTTSQLITLALADTELECGEREELAKAIHGVPREEIKTGKPAFPDLNWQGEELRRPRLATLVDSNSWLVFQLLGLEGTQDWLLTPSSMWPLFADYRKLEEFARNVSVTNDLAERGVRLITEFLNNVEDEEQRQALLQTVEYYRKLVPDMTKKNLTKC